MLHITELQSHALDHSDRFLDPVKASLVERFNNQILKRNTRDADSLADPDPQLDPLTLSALSVKRSLESLSLEELLILLEQLGSNETNHLLKQNTNDINSQLSQFQTESDKTLRSGLTLTNSELLERLSSGAAVSNPTEQLRATFPQTTSTPLQINAKIPTNPPALKFMPTEKHNEFSDISKSVSSTSNLFDRTALGGNIVPSLRSLQQNFDLLDTRTFPSNNIDSSLSVSQLQTMLRNLRQDEKGPISDPILSDESLNLKALNIKRQLGQSIERDPGNFVGGSLLDDPIVINSLNNKPNLTNQLTSNENLQPDVNIKIRQSDAVAEVLRRIELLEKESGGALNKVLNPISTNPTSVPFGGTLHVSFPNENHSSLLPSHEERPSQFHQALHLTPAPPPAFIPPLHNPHQPLPDPLNLNSHVPGPDPYSVPIKGPQHDVHHHDLDLHHEVEHTPNYKPGKELPATHKHDHHEKLILHPPHPDKIPPPTVLKVKNTKFQITLHIILILFQTELPAPYGCKAFSTKTCTKVRNRLYETLYVFNFLNS